MIHTAFMRFAIDVIFVNRDGRIVRIVRELPPWRIAAAFSAYATIECAAGALYSRDIALGDQLYLETIEEAESAAGDWSREAS